MILRKSCSHVNIFVGPASLIYTVSSVFSWAFRFYTVFVLSIFWPSNILVQSIDRSISRPSRSIQFGQTVSRVYLFIVTDCHLRSCLYKLSWVDRWSNTRFLLLIFSSNSEFSLVFLHISHLLVALSTFQYIVPGAVGIAAARKKRNALVSKTGSLYRRCFKCSRWPPIYSKSYSRRNV